MNRDHIAFANPSAVIHTAYSSLSANQDVSPALQLLGPAVLLRRMCDVLGLDLADVLYQAGRIARDARDFYPIESRALDTYIQKEMANG